MPTSNPLASPVFDFSHYLVSRSIQGLTIFHAGAMHRASRQACSVYLSFLAPGLSFRCQNTGHSKELTHLPGNGRSWRPVWAVLDHWRMQAWENASFFLPGDRPARGPYHAASQKVLQPHGGPLNGDTFLYWLSFLPRFIPPSFTCSLGPHWAIKVPMHTSLSQPVFWGSSGLNSVESRIWNSWLFPWPLMLVCPH